MKCLDCGFFGCQINDRCPFCKSKNLTDIKCSWISMYGYECCIIKDKVCISKMGHSEQPDGFMFMSRHTFEKFIEFYEQQKGIRL